MTRSVPALPLSVLIILVALTFWLSRFSQVSATATDPGSRAEPDLIIENFAAQKLTVNGDLEYAVNAEKMSHFCSDDSSLLENVVFVAVRADKPKMTAKAPRGRLVKRTGAPDEVVLDGGVRLESEANDDFPSMQLATPTLTVIPDKNLAHSTEGVRLQSPAGELVAKSFSLNTATRRVVFETVDLSYAPRKKN